MRKLKIRCLVAVTMLTLAFFVMSACAESTTPAFDYDDALIPPDIPQNASGGSPPGYYETSEYLIGDVAVGIIFLESNGSIDPSTEDWTSTEESNVINEITAGLNWLASQNPDADVSFTSDIHYRVPTSYEPINHRSYLEEHLWISEAMTFLGYPSTSKWTQVRNYINDLRNTLGTDWAYAMFIVDSSNDPDGRFTDGYCAYAWLGGPFLVMTYDNDGYGIGNMDYVAAHETCHMFYATDEYNGVTETSGYLGVQDLEGSGCMMERALSWWLCTNSREQLGWRDSDVDGIQDIVDTFPDTTLNPYSPDPTFDTNLTYTGSVVEVPYPNNNPYGTGRDVTINTITNVQFRVDSGTWTDATPSDGAFDEDEENFTFTTPPLSVGTHIIEVRGINSVGNIETSYASDTVTVRGYYLTVLAEQNGTSLTTGDVYIDDELVGYTGSTFPVATGTHNVSVNDFWDAGTLGYRYGFTNWDDGSTDNPRTIIVVGNTTIKAHFYKKWCPGDVNGDGYVSGWDVSIMSDAWMAERGDPNWDSRADLNADGYVSGWDLNILSDNWMNDYT